MGVKHWNVAEADETIVNRIVKETNLPEIVCKILVARNYKDADEIMQYIEQDNKMQSPYLLKDMDKAVKRIKSAIEKNERIAVYGDYDCDGVTATALLISYFQSMGVDTFYYIPDREQEGYGMNEKAIDQIIKKGAKLLITVDNGISSHKEIEHAHKNGLDVVITDHHTPRETLPKAIAVINPHRKDCPSKFKGYAGVGVVFLLVAALEEAEPEELLDYYSDLVTIGTIADLVPLNSDNRTIVKRGIEDMSEIGRAGILAILNIANITPPLNEESVSFGISPRINAAGRVGDVKCAVELLLTDDEEQAELLCQQLAEYNLLRRGIEEQVLLQISQYIKENPQILLQRVLVVKGENWHQGVMGIVASRLLDRYGKPTLVFSIKDGIAKGSGRSLSGFSLIDAITDCSEHILYFGGHTLAAGLTIAEKDLKSFIESIQIHAKEHYKIMPVHSHNIDCKITADELTIETVTALDILSPYGAGNQSPIFVLRNLKLTGIFPTADEKHMRLVFNLEGKEISTIFFRMTRERFHYKKDDILDAVVSISLNDWNNNIQLSIKIKDLRPSNYPENEAIASFERYQRHKRKEYGETCKKEDLIPKRDELEIIYKYLRKKEGYSYGSIALWEDLLDEDVDLARLQVALDIFMEAGLIKNDDGNYVLVKQNKKVDLEKTPTLSKLM